MRKISTFHRIVSIAIAVIFTASSLGVAPNASAQMTLNPSLPAMGAGPGLSLGNAFQPILLKGIKADPNNLLQFDFIFDNGDQELRGQRSEISSIGGKGLSGQSTSYTLPLASQQFEYTRLIKYFLASLAIPEDDLWVNLSPDEPDRIIPATFGQTEMGRDLLAQDYMLKQLTASLLNPDGEYGKKFWERVYARVSAQHGNVDIPVETFNKIWITPKRATIFENEGVVYVVESGLEVMLEEDYLALENHRSDVPRDENSRRVGFQTRPNNRNGLKPFPTSVSTDVIREILIPEIEHEVNTGRHFAALRQIYSAFILAAWYKTKMKNSLLNQVYADQQKINGLDNDVGANSGSPEEIYENYLEMFREGVNTLIKEEYDPISQDIIPRKYFTGGAVLQNRIDTRPLSPADMAMINSQEGGLARVTVDMAMDSESGQAAESRGTSGIMSFDDLQDVSEAIESVFSERQRETLLKKATVAQFQKTVQLLLHEFDIDVSKDNQYKRLMNVTRQTLEKGQEGHSVAEKMIVFLKEEAGLDLSHQSWGIKTKLLTLVYGVARARSGLIDDFQRDLNRVLDIFNIDLKSTRDIQKQKILTAVFYIAVAKDNPKKDIKSGIEYFQDTLDTISKYFGIGYQTISLSEKIRLITAAYAVALSKEAGRITFEKTLDRISERFAITGEEYQTISLSEKIRLITAAYHVALGKETGLITFEKTLDRISERFAITGEEYQTISLSEKIRLITAAYHVALGKETGLITFEKTLDRISERFAITDQEYQTIDLSEKIRLITAAYAVALSKEAGRITFEKTLDRISERFAITGEEYQTISLSEKIRLITAAYAVALGKEAGRITFERTLDRISERFAITDQEYQTIDLSEKIRLITAAYAVALSKEAGRITFEKTLDRISERFAITGEEYQTISLSEKIRLITAAYHVALGKEAGLITFEKALDRISEQFDIHEKEYKILEMKEKLDLIFVVYQIVLLRTQNLDEFVSHLENQKKKDGWDRVSLSQKILSIVTIYNKHFKKRSNGDAILDDIVPDSDGLAQATVDMAMDSGGDPAMAAQGSDKKTERRLADVDKEAEGAMDQLETFAQFSKGVKFDAHGNPLIEELLNKWQERASYVFYHLDQLKVWKNMESEDVDADPVMGVEDVGGIDLDSSQMDFEIKGGAEVNCLEEPNHAGCIQLNFTPEQIQNIRENLIGITPTIINIQPSPSLPLFLGLDKPQEDPQERLAQIPDLVAVKE